MLQAKAWICCWPQGLLTWTSSPSERYSAVARVFTRTITPKFDREVDTVLLSCRSRTPFILHLFSFIANRFWSDLFSLDLQKRYGVELVNVNSRSFAGWAMLNFTDFPNANIISKSNRYLFLIVGIIFPIFSKNSLFSSWPLRLGGTYQNETLVNSG